MQNPTFVTRAKVDYLNRYIFYVFQVTTNPGVLSIVIHSSERNTSRVISGSGVTALFGKKISSLTEISKSFGTHLTIHDDDAIDWPDFLCE